MLFNKKKNFCDMNPFFYALSTRKGIMVRNIKDLFGKEKFAKTKQNHKLSNVASEYQSVLIKRGKGIDIRTQENKAVNVRIASGKINGLKLRT